MTEALGIEYDAFHRSWAKKSMQVARFTGAVEDYQTLL